MPCPYYATMHYLTLDNTLPNPIDQFDIWFKEIKEVGARQAVPLLVEAFCLSTRDKWGNPDGRMILLKGYDARGFVFYTNFDSPKGIVLLEHAEAAMTFYWEPLRRQVRIQGSVEKVTDEEANDYFGTRPRDSQLGAWASRQSAVLTERKILDDRFKEFEKKFEEKEVPRPPYWSGFRLIPARIEFWQEQQSRLHDRILYEKRKSIWDKKLLYP